MVASTWPGYAWRPQSVTQRYRWKFCHCPKEIILYVRVTNDYLASPCFNKYSWSRIHSRSHMMLSNKATSWTSLSLSLLPPDQVLSILSTGTCHFSSNSFMSAVETSNLLPRLYLKRKNSHVTVQSLENSMEFNKNYLVNHLHNVINTSYQFFIFILYKKTCFNQGGHLHAFWCYKI